MNIGADITIIGAGPCGLTAALLATKKGFKVTVIEQKAPDSYHGYAHFINAQTLSILAKAGLDMTLFEQRSTSLEEEQSMVYATSLTQPFARIDLTDSEAFDKRFHHLGKYGAGIHLGYQLWRDTLLDACRRTGVRILWHHEVTGIDTSRKQLFCKYVGEEKNITYQWLICCDGVKSKIRSILNIRYSQSPKTWAKFLSIKTSGDLRPFVSQPSLMYWIYQIPLSACVVLHNVSKFHVWQIPLSHTEQATEFNRQDRQLRLIARFIGIDLTELKQTNINIEYSRIWHMKTHMIADMQPDGSIFLAGDAAHGLTPAGGLGLNTAIGDVDNLIWKLAHSHHNQSTIISSYQTERHRIGQSRVRHSIKHYENLLKVPSALGLPTAYQKPLTNLRYFGSSMIGNPQQSYIDDRLNEMLSQWAQKVYEGKNLVTKEVKKSVHQAVEDNRSYFDYIDEQLFFQYPKSQLTGTGSTFEHFKNSLTPGVWVGYMKIIDDGSVFFLGTHHLSYKPCIICYSSEDYAHILSHKQRESKRLDVDCYIISPYSYGYQDWSQKRPYILIRPDMIILNIYQAHEIANVVTDYKALLE